MSAAVMEPARAPRAPERLLDINVGAETIVDRGALDLPSLMSPGDVLVVNDAATLPGALVAGDLEVRLVGARPDGSFRAVLFGAGDWRTPTEHRPAPPAITVGDVLPIGGLTARIERILAPRLVDLRFDATGATLWLALYRHGRPVQYSHLREDLAIWDVQTSYATRPWSAEIPSAGRPLTFATLAALARRGVRIATLTHACGLSATGDAELDAMLPLPERYELPQLTIDTIKRAERVIAVGTSVVRALEGNVASLGALSAGDFETDLRIDAGHGLRVVDGLLTGMHDATASHHRLLEAFAPRPLLERAYEVAARAGYRGHEFGDLCLIRR